MKPRSDVTDPADFETIPEVEVSLKRVQLNSCLNIDVLYFG